MITQPTVFIIGAGASNPYGYPTGYELRQKILSGSWSDWAEYRTKVDEFVQHFRGSNNESIDLFLSRNPQYSQLGKAAVAFYVLEAERKSNAHQSVIGGPEADWYAFLFNRMVAGIVAAKDINTFEENKCVFITFNYDRSFEHFVFDSLRHTFTDVDESVLKKIWNSQPFYHVYGQVAELPWQNSANGIGYKANYNNKPPAFFTDKILLIGDERSSIDTIAKQQLIAKAERIFFLGFGFHEENLSILDFPNVLSSGQKVYGSAKGFFHEELDKIAVLVTGRDRKNFGSDFHIESDSGCKDILRKFL